MAQPIWVLVQGYPPQQSPGVPTHPIYNPGYPDQSLPGPQPTPGWPPVVMPPIYYPPTQPPRPTHPMPPYPDQGLPGNQPYPDQGLPQPQPHPDQGLPGNQPYPGQGLPGNQPYPDQGLPRPPGQPTHPWIPPVAGGNINPGIPEGDIPTHPDKPDPEADGEWLLVAVVGQQKVVWAWVETPEVDNPSAP